MGLDRVKTVAERMALRFDCPVITVAGTNGKGSTCAMLEAVLLQAGYRTGVYTSPHLVHFEERCRLHGESASAEAFADAFAAVEAVRGDVSLTYFEFSTLGFLHLMSKSNLDVAILEVGLGGRLDAVNIIDADCAVITSIDLDHMAILGNDRESIGFEKAGIMRAGRPVIVSDPVPPQSVIDHAAAVGAELWLFGRDFNFSGDKQQWAWAGRDRRYSGMAYPALRGANQLINASGVLVATRLERRSSSLPGTTNDKAELEGLVTRFASATDFDVAGQRVTTTGSTQYEDGTAASIALNAAVEVAGAFDASGRIVAQKIEFRRESDLELTGRVDSVNAAGNTLTVLGQSVRTTAQTRCEDKSSADLQRFSLADLRVGDSVEVRGYREGGVLVASLLEREDTAGGAGGGTVDV
jgi:hypothetical protein